MALPAIVGTGTDMSPDNRCGPYVASDGDLFVVMADVSTAQGDPGEIEVYRSTDGGETWGSGVTWGTVSVNPQGAVLAYDTWQDGDTIHVVGYEDDGGTTPYDIDIRYRAFDMATNAWTGSIDTVFSTTVDLRKWNVSVVKRTSDVVILHQGTDNEFITGIPAVSYSLGSAGSWSDIDNEVSGGTSGVLFNNAYGSMQGSQADEVHLLVHNAFTGGADFISARTLHSPGGWTGFSNSVFMQDAPARIGTKTMQTWNESGTQKISWWEDDTFNVGEESGGNELDLLNNPPASVVPDSNSSDETTGILDGYLYVMMKRNSDDNFYIDKAVAGGLDRDQFLITHDQLGLAWGTDVLAFTNTYGGASSASGNIFTHSSANGGRTVFGVVYQTDTSPPDYSYNEYSLMSFLETATDDADVTDNVSHNLVSPNLETEVSLVSDISGSGWDSAPTPSQSLFEQVDEEAPSDTDYIFAEDSD